MSWKQHGCSAQALTAKIRNLLAKAAGVTSVETPANGIENGTEFTLIVNSSDGAIFSIAVERLQAPTKPLPEGKTYRPRSVAADIVAKRTAIWRQQEAERKSKIITF